MKSRIVFTETGTGETETFDTDIADLTVESVMNAIDRLQLKHCADADPIGLSAEAFIIQGDRAAFILSSHDKKWFGDMLWHGVVYTTFAGEVNPI